MAVNINVKKLEEFIKIQKERQKLTQELSEKTGMDIVDKIKRGSGPSGSVDNPDYIEKAYLEASN